MFTKRMKIVSTKLIFAEVLECIYTLFNAAERDMECFNLQLQMHNIFIFETLKTDIWNGF